MSFDPGNTQRILEEELPKCLNWDEYSNMGGIDITYSSGFNCFLKQLQVFMMVVRPLLFRRLSRTMLWKLLTVFDTATTRWLLNS